MCEIHLPPPPWPVCIVTPCRCFKESLAPAKKKASGWIQGEERTLESLLEEHQRWLTETGGDRSVRFS